MSNDAGSDENSLGNVEVIPPKMGGKVGKRYTTRNRPRKGYDTGEYAPSVTETMILDVLLDPYHRMSSVSRQCEIAGVSRATYYRAFQSKDFVIYYRERLNDLIHAQGGQLINIGIREARKGNFPFWKVLMEMGGFYSDKKDLNIDAEVTHVIRFVDPDDPDDE